MHIAGITTRPNESWMLQVDRNLIEEEAGRKQVSLLAFPEGFIQAHPIWYHFLPATAPKSLMLAVELFKNSVEIPSPATDALGAATARARTHVVIGVCEKRPKASGTLFNTQHFVCANEA